MKIGYLLFVFLCLTLLLGQYEAIAKKKKKKSKDFVKEKAPEESK
jgi:hypothetical protein